MTVYVQVVDNEKPCVVVNAANVEEQKTTGDVVIKDAKDGVIGRFYISRIAGWWTVE